ncbi:GNAT family N-acetyltransferase [Pseudonocardia sp. H11422]|uniref:GNAT family N-acetyltransferase n=1 Tax=Pseudonocardia sp. H11422 TaxID=2835866 RepID=UPI001BDC6042|nr:GNAT family N-acetyltransferase [Pseudonocardia sp. H11422]
MAETIPDRTGLPDASSVRHRAHRDVPQAPVRTAVVDDDLTEEWDDLADRLAASPFHRPGWFTAWWSAFGAGRPRIVRSYRDGRLAGVLPVAHSRGVVTGLENEHTFCFGPLAEDDAVAADLVAQALADARWRAAVGHLLPSDFRAFDEYARSHGFATHSFIQQRSPYITVDRPFEEYRTRRERRHLRQLERGRDRLAGQDELEIVIVDDPDELSTVVGEAFRVESLGWKGESGTAILSDPRTHRFYGDVCRWAAGRGILRIGFVRLGGRAIASDICLEDAGVHYSMKTGYDPEYRSSAPGLILFHDMLERAFALKLRYEMLGDAEPYKMRWTDEVHEVRRMVIYPPTLTGRGARGAVTVARRARPAVQRAVSGARSVLRRAEVRTTDGGRRRPGGDV